MNNTYNFKDGTLIVYHKDGVKDYCKDHGISLSKFNKPVCIDSSVTDCNTP